MALTIEPTFIKSATNQRDRESKRYREIQRSPYRALVDAPPLRDPEAADLGRVHQGGTGKIRVNGLEVRSMKSRNPTLTIPITLSTRATISSGR